MDVLGKNQSGNDVEAGLENQAGNSIGLAKTENPNSLFKPLFGKMSAREDCAGLFFELSEEIISQLNELNQQNIK